MIARKDFLAALGDGDAGFDRALDAALRQVCAKEARPLMKKKLSIGLLAAVIAALALMGAALAVTRSGILDRIFTNSEPSERASEAVMHLVASDSCPYGRLTVTDYVMDGEDLYVDWTFETDSEENLVIQGDLMLYDTDMNLTNEMPLGEGESIQEETTIDLREGAGQTRRMRDGNYSAMSHAHLDGGRPTQPFDVARTMYIVRPSEDIARISAPTEGWYDDGPITIENWPEPIELVQYDSLYVTASKGWVFDQSLEMGKPAWISAYRGWGGQEAIEGEVIAKLEVRFTIDPATVPNYTVAITEPQQYDCGEFDFTLTRCEFTGFNARIEYELKPKNKMNRSDLYHFRKLQVRLPDGTTPELDFVYRVTKQGTVLGLLTSNGGLTATPDHIQLIPLEYVRREDAPQFFDLCPHEDEAVTVELSPVE